MLDTADICESLELFHVIDSCGSLELSSPRRWTITIYYVVYIAFMKSTVHMVWACCV